MQTDAKIFEDRLLSYARGIGDVKDAADRAPADATLNAYAAAAEMFSMTGDAASRAAPYLDRASAAARSPDDRLLVQAIAAWTRDDLDTAIRLHRERLRARPDDLAAAKICQLHHIDRGDAEGLLETVRLVLPANQDNHFVLGQLAFALEQVGDLHGAEATARRALRLAEADDPWSHHALAHVFYSRGDVGKGVDWIERHDDLWERSTSFMFTHAWWHAAIAHLDDDRPDAALAIYDNRLFEACPNCVQSLVNAISLLARLTLRGIDVGDRWTPVAEALVERADDRVNGFLDLHYAYGLALAGQQQQAAAMVAALAGTLAGDGARGLIAHAGGRMAEAADLLQKSAPKLRELGGSNEQRDLYELVEIDACRRAGRHDRARMLLKRRVLERPAIGWQRQALTALATAA